MVLRIPRPEGYDSGDDGEAPLRPVQELREDPGHSATIMIGQAIQIDHRHLHLFGATTRREMLQRSPNVWQGL